MDEPTIRDTVRRLMDEHGWKGTTLAPAIGLQHAALSRRLNGHVAFRATELLAIARVLEIDVRELYGLPTGETSAAS